MKVLKTPITLVKTLLFALTIALFAKAQAQSIELTEIIIGDGTETSCTVPFRACANGWNFGNYTESIYPSDAIGTECVIHSISFSLAETASYSTHMTVYMGTTDEPSHTSPMGWVSPEDLTMVCNAPIEFNGQEWGKIVLDAPYHYSGGNLVIVVSATVYSNSSVVTYGTYAEGATIVGETYWSEGTVYDLRPNIKLEVATEPILVANPVAVEMGIRPNGCWAEPPKTILVNEGLSGTITSATCDNNYFNVVSPEFPYPFAISSTIPYTIATGTGEGSQTGTFTFTYDDNKTLEIPISAETYTPVMPDVWELARQVTTFPYSETITSEMAVYDNYKLPGNMTDGKDVVFKLDFDSDVLLTANVIDGNNGKVALYPEGFEGQGGPASDNFSYLGYEHGRGLAAISFEDGDFGSLNWTNDTVRPWIITTHNPHEGTDCMQSTMDCGESGSSEISIELYVPYTITMSFWARISSFCAYGYFFIDGIAKINGIEGYFDWEYYSYEVQPGIHTFKWVYTKTMSGLCGGDNSFFVDNIYFGDVFDSELNTIDERMFSAGSYYLVASSTSEEFTVNIDKVIAPSPVVASSPFPADQYNCYGNDIIALSWDLGDYTKEYQLLFGETNPPTEVLVDWTSELAENYEVLTESAKTYYWRVNERNSSGTTEGPVWSFSTFRDIHVSADSIIYVTPTGAGIKDGSSWANAASSIQAAIDVAADYSEHQPVVWVAKGTYLANGVYQTGNGKTFCILSHDGVKLYGGFNGDEPANFDLSLRDLENNATILDGESQCYVVGSQSGEWDGFVMQYGGEGGLYAYDGASTVHNCKILHSEGTGVFVDNGSLDCFHNEVSYHSGDGISQANFWNHLDIRDCIISYNSGTGVFANLCIRCKICNNGNGFYMRSSMGGAVISCLVANNDGFGVQCDYIVNSTIVNNGTGIARTYYYSDFVLCNSILWGNERQWDQYWSWDSFYTITMSNNAIQGGASGKNGIYTCIKLDDITVLDGVQPGFVHPSSGIGSNFSDGDWTLSNSSPCINMGMENLSIIPEESSFFCYNTGFTTPTDYLDYDLAGNQRIKQGRIDLGTFESPYEKPNYQFPIRPDANNFIFVKEDGHGNGSSWANATSNLQEAIETAVLYDPVSTIWVAQGTYTGSDYSFQVKERLKMFGGFEGNEPTDYDLNQRDFLSHTSVLDGGGTKGVIYQRDTLSTTTAAIIDGFTIQNGVADNGAGAYLLKNTTLSHCIVRNNMASGDKAGKGGGIYTNEATIKDCFVENNTANQGGGIYAVNSKIIQSHIGNNTATVQGGGLNLHNSDLFQSHIVRNEGGGLFVSLEDNNTYSNLTNNIIWGNEGYNLNYSSSSAQVNTALSHCAIEGCTNTDNGNIPLSSDNNDLFGPQFIMPTENVGLTESQGDWHLATTSLCIDAGTNTLAGTTLPDYDMDGNPRVFQNGTVDMGVYEALHEAQSVLVDVIFVSIMQGESYDFFGTLLSESGIYEHAWTDEEGNHLTQLHLSVLSVLYVSEDGAGTKDGSSWANALDGNTVLESGYTKLADVLQNAQCNNCFWVASGTYLPCGDSDASKHFVLNEGVSVYGGFTGDETSLEERDVENNLTIFSGELQGDDNETNNTDGIFITAPTTALWSYNATLDGLTLTKGYTSTHRGAALLVNESTAVTLNQCQVHDNREGGIYNSGKLEIKDSDLSNNDTQEDGDTYMSFTSGYTAYLSAGVLCNTDQGFVSLNNCLFQSNYSNNNGAIFNSGTMEVDASVFEDNYADCYGVIMSPGKMKVHNTTFNNNRSEHYIAVMMIWDSLELVNCNITNNNSNYYTSTHFPSGGSQNFASKRTSGIEAWGHCYVDNCNFINNDAGTCSGGALSVTGSANIVNCLFRGNTGVRPWRDPETGGNIGSVVLMLQTDGGALYVGGTATATDCVFEGNSGVDGSTIGVNGTLVMERCVIANSSSSASSHWGSIKNNHELTINNSLIVNNQGGLFFQLDGIHTTLNNTTIANTADELFILENLGESDRKSIIDFNNCIISGYSTWMDNIWDCQYELNMNNTLVSQQISGTEGNENDPLFVNPTTYLGYNENVDPLDFDWSLQANSPCIDAGDVGLLNFDPSSTDLAGEPRVINGQVDMGAYEYGTDYMFITATASPSNGGIITGAGAYTYGAIAILTATANEGFSFINWTKDSDVVSTDTTYSFAVTEPGTYTANFMGYNITALASPEAGGVVEGSGNYEYGATATLTAKANSGYTFVNWTKDSTVVSLDEVFSFTVSESGTYVANFNQNSYTVTVVANPEVGGTVTGSGTFYHGEVTTLTASPNEGYTFINWTKDGTIISTDDVYNFTVIDSATYVANFCPIYNITAMAAPETGGEVDGSGVYNEGATATLTATANEHYHFVNWTKDSEEVSTNSIYDFTVTEAGIYIANFELDSHTVTAEANPTEGGTIEGAGIYTYGTTATLTATPNEGYLFYHWSNDGAILSNNPSYSFTVTSDDTITANFADESSVCSILFDLHDSYGDGWNGNYLVVSDEGGILGQYTINSGHTTSYTLPILTGSHIILTWIQGHYIEECSFDIKFENGLLIYHGSGLSVSYQYEFVLNCDESTPPRTITAVAEPVEGGSIEGDGIYPYGTTITLTATANENGNYTFMYWTENDSIVSYDAEYSFEVALDRDLVANFSLPLTITTEANPTEGGTVTGAGVYNYGTTCTLTATPNDGYLFHNWSIDGNVVSNKAIYDFAVTSSETLTANFTDESSICGIVFDLHDSYGDGWNGNYLVVSDEGGILGQYTISSGYTASYTLPILTGSHIILTWISGSWSYECSFTMRYKNGTVIYEGTNLNGDFLFEFDVDCSANIDYHFVTSGNWSEASNWSGNALPQSTDEAFIEAACILDTDAEIAALTISEGQSLTIESGKTLNVPGTLANANASGLVIEDGAQLLHNNDVPATLHKEIAGYGTDSSVDSGWYAIASPVMDDLSVSGLTSGSYDLYAFIEQDFLWYNQKAHAESFTSLAPNTGYLYANTADKTLVFAGETPATNTANVTIPLSYLAQGDMVGYNLVGNPFTRCLTSDDAILVGNVAMTTYLTVDGGNELVAHDIASDPILPGQGFFVQASEPGQSLVINDSSRSTENTARTAFIRIEAGNRSFTDRAYLQIGHGNALRKTNLGNNTPIVYVVHDGSDFAAATIGETSGEIQVGFRALENTDHTISVNTVGLMMNYLHLIDNLTGADIDLLATPSYTFSARSDDNASRFKLVFSTQL